jgi:hypothetical protein
LLLLLLVDKQGELFGGDARQGRILAGRERLLVRVRGRLSDRRSRIPVRAQLLEVLRESLLLLGLVWVGSVGELGLTVGG